MHDLSRRECLASLLALVAGSTTQAGEDPRAGWTLSMGTYSFPGMTTEDALGHIARLGFDGTEIHARPEADAAPSRMTAARRKTIRGFLQEKRLQLASLMEHLVPSPDDKQHALDRNRLLAVLELARDLGGDRPPIVQTVLGSGRWEDKKNLYRDRLGDYLELCRKTNVTLAIKPHRFMAMTQPEEAVWLVQQLNNPALLKMVYDYSHYAYRNMTIEATVAQALPITAQIAVKDAVRKGDKVVFVLPGEAGTIDYVEILQRFHKGGFRGDVCCEVSVMVSGVKGYEPVAAATTCYRNMSRLLEKAGLRQKS